jgi:hypothetical protein
VNRSVVPPGALVRRTGRVFWEGTTTGATSTT